MDTGFKFPDNKSSFYFYLFQFYKHQWVTDFIWFCCFFQQDVPWKWNLNVCSGFCFSYYGLELITFKVDNLWDFCYCLLFSTCFLSMLLCPAHTHLILIVPAQVLVMCPLVSLYILCWVCLFLGLAVCSCLKSEFYFGNFGSNLYTNFQLPNYFFLMVFEKYSCVYCPHHTTKTLTQTIYACPLLSPLFCLFAL